MINVNELTYDYPGKRALSHISVNIKPKTITALVGPNGAGKTTLLRCIAALDLPISGSIRVAGLEVFDNPREAHKLMGYLPDTYGLYEDLSVKQCLLYHAMVQNIPKDEHTSKIADIAKQLEISDLLDREVSTLSRGQRQRVAIAQSILHCPKVLLLDEPASGLDPEARRHLSKLLLKLCQEGMTIIVSSHILSELEDYCTHMLILSEGQIIKFCAKVEATLEQKSLFHLKLSYSPDGILERLKNMDKITDIRQENETLFSFSYDSDTKSQEMLLKSFVETNMPVCSFYEVTPSMSDLYLQATAEHSK